MYLGQSVNEQLEWSMYIYMYIIIDDVILANYIIIIIFQHIASLEAISSFILVIWSQ